MLMMMLVIFHDSFPICLIGTEEEPQRFNNATWRRFAMITDLYIKNHHGVFFDRIRISLYQQRSIGEECDETRCGGGRQFEDNLSIAILILIGSQQMYEMRGREEITIDHEESRIEM